MAKIGDTDTSTHGAGDTRSGNGRRAWMAQAGALVLGGTGLTCWSTASAQEGYPTKPIRIVVPFAAGASNDVLARTFAERLRPILKQPVIVENRIGAAGVIGSEHVAHGPADGYTLLFFGGGSITPVLIKDLRLDMRKHLRPVISIARGGMTLLVSGGVPVKSFAEFIEHARREKGRINYGYSARTSMFAAELLRTGAGFDAVGVPYKGSGEVMSALVSNEVQFVFDSPLQYLALIKEGRLRAVAHSAQERTPVLPDVPTLAELGNHDLKVGVSFGVWSPANTPDAIVQRLNAAFNEVLSQPDVRQRILDGGSTPSGGAPEVHDLQIAGEQTWLASAAQKLNYKPE